MTSRFSTVVLLFVFASPLGALAAADENIHWLIDYDGDALPDSTWIAIGNPRAKIENGALHLTDDSNGFGHYRATWKAKPDDEIIVEATVKVGTVTGSQRKKPATALWPWRDGAPVAVLLSDGRHQDGLVLFEKQVASFTDRFIPMDTTKAFHTYRLVIHGTTMSMSVDGEQRVQGENAFSKAADSPEPFIMFGSNASVATGDAHWSSIKLGIRKAVAPPQPSPLKITISPAWDIPREDVKQTRPYLYDMGKGLLLMSIAQGPDAFYEPYGLLKSLDAGKTWSPISGLDQLDTTPLPAVRRPDESILATSRWTWLQPNGQILGKTVHLDANAVAFTMIDNKIVLPPQFANDAPGDQLIVERHIWNDADGGATLVVWTRKAVRRSDGRKSTERMSHLVKTTDSGRTWNYFSTIGPGGEPAVARLSPTEMIAVIRGDRNSCLTQTYSHDSGKTWSQPVALEVGKVAPDLTLMSNGVLACSYGRPASCIMFSLDRGKTWCSHHVVSRRVRFNYTAIREIRPGRLLYVHDAPKLNAVYIDVDRLQD